MISIKDIITKNKNYTNHQKFKKIAKYNDEQSLTHFLYSKQNRISTANYLLNKYEYRLPQEIANIFKWLRKDFSIEINNFFDLLDLKNSPIHDYYKYIYIVYIQLLLHDLKNNKDAITKPNLIKGSCNSFYTIDDSEFVPNSYYDVLKTELFYKLSVF